MGRKEKERPRGRINLNFDLSSPKELAVYHILQSKSRARQATEFITGLVFDGLTASPSQSQSPQYQSSSTLSTEIHAQQQETGNGDDSVVKACSLAEPKQEVKKGLNVSDFVEDSIAAALEIYGG